MPSIFAKLGIFLNKSNHPGEITNRQKLLLSFPAMPVILSNVLIHNAFLKYYTDLVGLDVKYVGMIYLIFGIWNAINDPLMGVFIDRFRFTEKRGKFVYIMRISVPVTLFAALLMVFAQPSWQEWVTFAYLLTLLFFYDTTQTAYSIAYSAYRLVAAPTSSERMDVSVYSTYIGHIGGFLGTLVPTLLLVGETKRGLTIILFTAVILLNGVLYLLALKPLKDEAAMYRYDYESAEGELVRQVREHARDAIKSRGFLTYILYQFIGRGPYAMYFTPFLYLADHVLKLNGLQATIVDVVPGLMLFVAAPFIGKFGKKAGSRKAIIYSSIPTALGFLALFFVQNMWHALLAYTLMIVFNAVSGIVHNSMLGAIIDEDEQNTGNRKAGLYNGLNALLTIPVAGIQTVIFTGILSFYTFQSGVEQQSARAITGIRVGASIIPFLFTLAGIIPMLFSNITKEKEQALSLFSAQRHRTDSEALEA